MQFAWWSGLKAFRWPLPLRGHISEKVPLHLSAISKHTVTPCFLHVGVDGPTRDLIKDHLVA